MQMQVSRVIVNVRLDVQSRLVKKSSFLLLASSVWTIGTIGGSNEIIYRLRYVQTHAHASTNAERNTFGSGGSLGRERRVRMSRIIFQFVRGVTYCVAANLQHARTIIHSAGSRNPWARVARFTCCPYVRYLANAYTHTYTRGTIIYRIYRT